ncbi:MAG: Ppx/GppA phosphatase family protein [Sarcina sp.]
MNKIGIIDIGAESIDMLLSETSNKGYFKIIDELKEYINFGSDAISCCEISTEKTDKTIAILNVFKNMCLNAGASDILFVASEEVRNSESQKNFRKKLSEVLDTKFKVLSNAEDLYYTSLGATNSMFIENSLLVDINAHSVNLAFIENNVIKQKAFLPFGFIDISNKFDLNNNIDLSTLANLKNYINNTLTEIEWLNSINFDSIIGMGDSVISLGKIDRARKHYPIHNSHGYNFNLSDIKEIYNLIKSKDLEHRRQIAGLPEKAVTTILASSSILKLIATYTKIHDIEICGYGLREGLLFDYLETNLESKKDILDSSLTEVMDSLNINSTHANQVYNLSQIIFDKLLPLHKLTENKFKRILKTSSLLHDSGISIRYDNHHLHSFYIVLNSPINGLSHKELLMSAFATALHRNNHFAVPIAKYSSLINKLDSKYIEYIGIIIRIAEGLDRSLSSAVEIIDLKLTDSTAELIIKAHKNIDLEIQEAYRAKAAFETLYKRKLLITISK